MNRSRGIRALVVVASLGMVTAAGAPSAQGTPGAPGAHYREGDYAHGHALSILPPGENGLVNLAQYAQWFNNHNIVPANSNDQTPQYANLLYGLPGLTDSGLSTYYNDASFGVKPGDVTRVEHPNPAGGVTIYRDTRDVPHVYGNDVNAMAFGAGYAAAEDRLFLMDVLRHYGSGALTSFLGASCANEQMDHDQLLLAPYTPAQQQAQINALPREFGATGATIKAMGEAYVAGINQYVGEAQLDINKRPVEYLQSSTPTPQPWKAGDVIAVASLVGGIFGRGGGNEVANARLLQYLESQPGVTDPSQVLTALKEQNDPNAPTTIRDRAFPYEIPGQIDPSLTAVPDNASAPLIGGPTDTTPGCTGVAVNVTAARIVAALLSLPKAMSNALVVDANHSTSGHPIAVFGPQVSYFAPQILMQEDLHAPGYAAEGAAFPGTNLVVELGRGADYAWSATSAGSDITDQRLEVICSPNGGPPDPQGHFYLIDGHCLPMQHHTFTEATRVPTRTVIHHEIYTTIHGVVQGWTTASGGRPVALVNQRSTYNHELDSSVGFFGFGSPDMTHDATSWMASAAKVQYTFNWFYIDDRDIAYYVSGLDPIRRPTVNPNLPTWGTGVAEWQGFLSQDAHPHEINPPSGFFTSWNNKPAPGFSASDDQYGYGPVYRSQSLDEQINQQLALHNGRISRADLVVAMETAATVDLTGSHVLPELITEVGARSEPPEVVAMLSQLQGWLATGAHRLKANPADTQYADASAVAIMDELFPRLLRAVFDRLLFAGGVNQVDGADSSYAVVPMEWVNTPHNDGAHLGSAYDGGWEGYAVKQLRQLNGEPVAQPFPASLTDVLCSSGLSGCPAAIDSALAATANALATINQTQSVPAWTADTATANANVAMPVYDQIQFKMVGAIPQNPMDWQNRPTFQQVVEFPAHRPR
jgi:acyl-homoserine lactone acylase PvdQ